MNGQQAHTLQQHALDSLAELRFWLSSRQAELAPAAAGSVRQALYASWSAQVEAALRALDKAFPACERLATSERAPVELEPDSVPPTLPSVGAERSGRLPPSSRPPASRAIRRRAPEPPTPKRFSRA